MVVSETMVAQGIITLEEFEEEMRKIDESHLTVGELRTRIESLPDDTVIFFQRSANTGGRYIPVQDGVNYIEDVNQLWFTGVSNSDPTRAFPDVEGCPCGGNCKCK